MGREDPPEDVVVSEVGEGHGPDLPGDGAGRKPGQPLRPSAATSQPKKIPGLPISMSSHARSVPHGVVTPLDSRDGLLRDELAQRGSPHEASNEGLGVRGGRYAMCSMSGGMFTQVCIRSSYTEMDGPGNVGSAKAPTGMAMFSTS